MINQEARLTDCPRARVDLSRVDLGSDLLLYDEQRKVFHRLNSTAKRIYELCDGSNDTEEIVSEVSRLFPSSEPGEVRRDVDQVVQSLADKQLIVWVAKEVYNAGD